MNVVVDHEIWGDPQVDPLAVVSILTACSSRRHTLIIHPRDRPRIQAWIDTNTGEQGGLRRRLKRLVDETSRISPQAASTAAMITVVRGVSDWTRAHLCPEHAARALLRPLKLLVENSRNDGAFLLRIAEPSSRRALEHALQEGWIEFEMGGGLEELLQRIRALASHNDTATMIARARLWVMFDRDAHDTDRSRESDASGRMRQLAATVTVPWPLRAHQLERRAIENYVPLATLQRWWRGHGPAPEASRRAARVEAFCTLPATVRHSFNMKKGLLGDLPKARRIQLSASGGVPNDAELDPVFRSIDPSLRVALSGGFEGAAAAFSTPGAVQDNDLCDEVSPPERRRLIQSILERM